MEEKNNSGYTEFKLNSGWAMNYKADTSNKGLYNIAQYTRPGDSNRITREYFDSLLFELRHIDGTIPDTTLHLYGETFSTPVMMAALSHLDRARQNGSSDMAKGAQASGSVMWTGVGSEEELEGITATGARTIKIIKPYADNELVIRKIQHAEKCGCIAVGMDVDHGFDHNGNYSRLDNVLLNAKTVDEIKQFVQTTKLPFIVKGVLSEQDAYKCAIAGVGGIMVSHHHGAFDFAIPPLMVLPKIVKIVDGKIPVFVDCVVHNGFDVFKALALGATAVSVGQVMLASLLENGADGVAQTVKTMTAQLAGAMSCTCSPDITHIDPSVIWNR